MRKIEWSNSHRPPTRPYTQPSTNKTPASNARWCRIINGHQSEKMGAFWGRFPGNRMGGFLNYFSALWYNLLAILLH